MKRNFIKNIYLVAFIFCFQLMFFSCPLNAQINENKISSILFENNILIINTTGKITYTESRLRDPDRLVVDILNCTLDNKTQSDFKSPLDENISIAEVSNGHVRILFFGRASINRKSFLSNNDRTLSTKIVRISSEVESENVETQEESVLEKESPGKIKDIIIEHKDDDSEIQITTTKSVKYNTYVLKNPDRFAVDLLNVEPPDKSLPKFNQTPYISGFRVGRAASGYEATRIVIDLAKPNLTCDIGSTLIGNKIKVSIKSNIKKDENEKTSNIRVVIDPGHGGYDTGAQYGGFNEKDINFEISMKLKKELENKGVKVFITRDEDSFLSLAERVDITNSIKPHVFVSIHANAMKTSRAIRGVETYYWSSQSQKLAYHIHKNILNTISIPDHFIRKAQFFVIKHTSVPAVLCELAFLSNHDDRKLLASDAIQEKYAKAITAGILKFLDVDVKIDKSPESGEKNVEQKLKV